MDALITNSHSLSGDRVAPVSEQGSKAAKNVAHILLTLGIGAVVLEEGYHAVLHNRRRKQLGKSGHTGAYKSLHVECKDHRLRLWVGEQPHLVWVQFRLDAGRLRYEDSVVCDGVAEWREKGQETTITDHWRQAGYGSTQWTRVQVLV